MTERKNQVVTKVLLPWKAVVTMICRCQRLNHNHRPLLAAQNPQNERGF